MAQLTSGNDAAQRQLGLKDHGKTKGGKLNLLICCLCSFLGPSKACKIKFRLRELISCLCSAAALAVCFEGRVAGLEATETGNEISQPKFELARLLRSQNSMQIISVNNKQLEATPF